MKFRVSLAFLLLALLFCSFNALPDHFTALLNRAGLSFTEPEGWTETLVISNNKMRYDYAITNTAKTVEIRYTIRPMDSLLIQYQKMKQNGSVMLHPNTYFKPGVMATLMNISSGARPPQMRPYDSLAVKKSMELIKVSRLLPCPRRLLPKVTNTAWLVPYKKMIRDMPTLLYYLTISKILRLYR